MTFKNIAIKAAAALVVTIVLIDPALAQETGGGDGSWVDPIIDLFLSIQTGLGKLGAIVVGIGVMVLGLWAGLSGRMDWSRAVWIVFGGVLVVSGPALSSALLGGS